MLSNNLPASDLLRTEQPYFCQNSDTETLNRENCLFLELLAADEQILTR